MKDFNHHLNYKFDLTQREIEIVHLLLKGRSNLEIAQETNVTLETVKALIVRLKKKINVKSRYQAILFLDHEKKLFYETQVIFS